MMSDWFLDIIESDDACSVLFLVMCLGFVGVRVQSLRPDLACWGRRIGMLTLLAYVIFRCITNSPTAPEELLWIFLRGLLAAAFLTSITWILLPAIVGAWSITGARLLKVSSTTLQATKQRQHEQQVAEQHRHEHLARTREFERSAPERDRLQSEAEARAKVERDAAETARRRREEARLRSELSYERHARQLSASFPRERFEQFMDRYLSAETPPELVEQREQLLKEMIVDSLGTNPAPKFASMTDLAAFFAARRREIDELPHDEDAKDAYRIQLNKQEDEALRKLLKP